MVSAAVQTAARGLHAAATGTCPAARPMWQSVRGIAQQAPRAVACNSAASTMATSSRSGFARGTAQSSAALRRSLIPSTMSSAASFHSTAIASHGGIERPEPGTGIKITFRDSKGKDVKTVEANEGDDLLSVAHEYDIELEGACEGSIACSTCHVILEPDVYDKLEEPGDDENDMLDLAFGLTDTSRLGCQVKVTRELDGMVAQLPSATRNMYVDGAKAGH